MTYDFNSSGQLGPASAANGVTPFELQGASYHVLQLASTPPTPPSSAITLSAYSPDRRDSYVGDGPTYPLGYGLRIVGTSGSEDGSTVTRGFDTALGIGDSKSAWFMPANGRSYFGTAISAADWSDYGIRIWKRWAGSTGPSLSLGWDSAGSASFAAADGIDFAGTVVLHAGAANVLHTPDAFGIAQTAVPATTTSGTGFHFGATGIIEQMRNATGTFWRLYGSTSDLVGTPTFRARITAANVMFEWSAAGGNSLDTSLTRSGVGILQTTQLSATSGLLGGIGGTAVASTGLDTATALAMRRRDSTALVNGNNNNVTDFGSPGSTAKSFVKITTAAAGAVVTGCLAGGDGQLKHIVNKQANSVQFTNDDTANSTAANCMLTKDGATATIATGASITFIYDTGASRWLEVNRNI